MSEKLAILIENGTVVDGSGSQPFQADVGIREGRIVSIGKTDSNDAIEVIDALGLTVCPGFIDMHSHSDASLPFDNRHESMIRQGVTTSVVGNCGFSLAPVNEDRIDMLMKELELFSPPGQEIDITWRSFEEYLKVVTSNQMSSNIVPLVGFGTVRIAGGPAYENRKPTQTEIDEMKKYVAEAMESGAFGMSTGLIYAPQVYANTMEVVELTKSVADYNGLYFSHIRGEGATVVQAVQELISIVDQSGCRGGQVGHHKVAGHLHWGKSIETLKLIDDANKCGLNIACDQYPYVRGMTSLDTVLPPWAHEGGFEKVLARLKNPEDIERIRHDIENGLEGWENMIDEAGWDGIYISSVKYDKWKSIEGKSLAEITNLKGYSDPFQVLIDLLIEEELEVVMTMESMGEEDIHRIMKGEYTMIGSDGWGVSPTGILGYGKPHPRLYGTFPRILGKYVREDGILKLEEAIWKMTGLPARMLELKNRGTLREGAWADLVVFDAKSIKDQATFLDPHQFPVGIHHVIVNGAVVVQENRQIGTLPGAVLKSNS